MFSLTKIVLCISLNFLICRADLNLVKDDRSTPKAGTEVKVIIIGSGPAGIAAAAQLLENNFTNLIILEAEKRIGGRIYSVPLGDSIIDLGAEWCQGKEGNAVYELANGLNLLEDDSYENFEFYHSSQKPVDQEFLNQLYTAAYAIYMGPIDGEELSLGDFIQRRFITTITKNYGNDSKKLTLAKEFFSVFESGVLSEEGAFSWFSVAAKSGYEDTGIINLAWKGRGYKTILDVLTKKYPNPSNELPVYSKILFGKDVTKVSSVGNAPEAECSDNTKFAADHIIWTPSLGVLKHRHKYLFDPTLSKEKVNAINVLGIDAVLKVLYYFPQRWWPDHVSAFFFIWSDEDIQRLSKEFPYGPDIEGISWLSALQLIGVNTYNHNVLTAWICGKAVPIIEKLGDDLIINGTMFVLQKFLGQQFHNLTWPQKIIRENWYSNDHFRGTYSYDTLASSAEKVSQRDILAEPLKTTNGKPTVLFAGEATNPNHFGTVHGAIETGRREANRIINYYKEN